MSPPSHLTVEYVGGKLQTVVVVSRGSGSGKLQTVVIPPSYWTQNESDGGRYYERRMDHISRGRKANHNSWRFFSRLPAIEIYHQTPMHM